MLYAFGATRDYGTARPENSKSRIRHPFEKHQPQLGDYVWSARFAGKLRNYMRLSALAWIRRREASRCINV